jgi:transposase
VGQAGRTGRRDRRRRGLASVERKELAQLRAEIRRLGADVEILKRATAFFAQETR